MQIYDYSWWDVYMREDLVRRWLWVQREKKKRSKYVHKVQLRSKFLLIGTPKIEETRKNESGRMALDTKSDSTIYARARERGGSERQGSN